MRKLLVTAVALLCLAGMASCSAKDRALIEAAVNDDEPATTELTVPAVGSWSVHFDGCDSVTVTVADYPADGAAFFWYDGTPPYHLKPAGDSWTAHASVGRWGIYIRDSDNSVLVDLDGQPGPVECTD
jgi:hypothetical protein